MLAGTLCNMVIDSMISSYVILQDIVTFRFTMLDSTFPHLRARLYNLLTIAQRLIQHKFKQNKVIAHTLIHENVLAFIT